MTAGISKLSIQIRNRTGNLVQVQKGTTQIERTKHNNCTVLNVIATFKIIKKLPSRMKRSWKISLR